MGVLLMMLPGNPTRSSAALAFDLMLGFLQPFLMVLGTEFLCRSLYHGLLQLTGWAWVAWMTVFIGLGTILMLLLVSWLRDSEFMRVDSCIDRGGRWNYEARVCDYE